MSIDLKAVLTDWPTSFLRIKATLEIENITNGGNGRRWNFSMCL